MGTAPPADGRSPYDWFTAIGHLPLVGRKRELDVLRALFVHAPETPHLLLVTGESGIGKSRLLAEAQSLAVAAGWYVLRGESDEEIGALPYFPWLQVIRACLNSLEANGRQISPVHRETLAPLVAKMISKPSRRGVTLTAEAQKLRLFDAVTDLLTSLTGAHPTLLILDDIQWFDHASAELLRYVVPRVGGPFLFLLAGRDEDLPRNAALTSTLDDLNRRRLVQAIPLQRLAEAETAQLVAAIIGGTDPHLTHILQQHSEGNPFFAEEVLKTLSIEGRLGATSEWTALPLPRGVVAVLDRRLDRLSQPCLALLRVAALIGRRFPLEAAAIVADLDEEGTETALDEATAAAVLRPLVTDETWGEFLHDRIREVLLIRLNPLKRRALHLRIARALEIQAGEHDVAQLAHHYARGKEYRRAVYYAQRAAAAARQAHAYAEAVAFSRQALKLSDEGNLRIAPRERATFLSELSAAAALTGDYATALASYDESARMYLWAGDRRAAGDVQRQIGALYARREDIDSALTHYRFALDLLGEESDSPDTAELLIQFGAIHGMSMASYGPAIDYGRRGLEMAIRLADPGVEAGARLALANTILRVGDLSAGYDVLHPALALALQIDDTYLGAEINATLANYYYWIADLHRSQVATEHRRALALQGGDPYALRHVYSWFAHLAYAQGRWTEATDYLAAAEPIIARLDSPEPRAFQQQIAGLIAFQQGDTATALALLAESMATFRRIDPGTLIWYLGCYGRAQLAAGDITSARHTLAELDALIEQLPAKSLPRAPALAQLGLAAIELDDNALVHHTYMRLQPYTGQHHWVLIDRALGALASYRADWATAYAYLESAERAAVHGAILPEFALTLAARSALHLRRGEQAQAKSTLLAARAQFTKLGMVAEERRADRLLATLAVEKHTHYPAGLSAREVEVLRHIAIGRTNRDIADLLSISERTVNNHVAHILGKTNTGNRTAAAAFALRHGLA